MNNLNFGIIGLGIMGGSIARSIRENILNEKSSSGKIYAFDINQDSLDLAKKENIIDQGFSKDDEKNMLQLCDVVFICLYPKKTIEFLKANKENFKTGSVITDISGVKSIYDNMEEVFPTNADFVLGHPMAGGEKEGFANSNGNYFINHNYIIIPQERNKPESITLIENLVTAMKFSRITKTDCKTHDEKIGFTSQLCHVVASAMVESAADPSITSFGGGSFEDLTRIAMINAPLWTELFLSNKVALLKHIKSFISKMQEFETLIQNEDAQQLEDLLKDVRKKRIEMNELK
ncbi:MAG: prephenate dehydrogenase [Treponema sp.]|nr:prephenate dehydrogenase [Treponema sp.]